MIIKKIISATILIGVASICGANTIIDEKYYADTQSTYVNDIDAINIVMSSMNKKCWLNAPYGGPHLKDLGLLHPTDCTSQNIYLNLNKEDVLSSVVSFTLPDLSKFDDNMSTAVRFSDAASAGFAKFPKEQREYFINELDKILVELKITQDTIKKTGGDLSVTAPQVLTIAVVHDESGIDIYLSVLNAPERKQTFLLLNSQLQKSILTFEDFQTRTRLTTNPLYKAA